MVGEWAAAPMWFAMPDPSVYTWRVFGSLFSSRKSSCSFLASSLGALAMCMVVFDRDHHGGLMYGCISSMVSVTYCGYFLTKYSRLELNLVLFVVVQYLTAFRNQVFVGCFAGRV